MPYFHKNLYSILPFSLEGIYVGESIPLIVYGILKVDKVLISAELSGLKLEANTTKVHASGTYKKKVKGES